ncbi:MAG: DUF5684 domain-containing protein [Nitrospirota bacterium]
MKKGSLPLIVTVLMLFSWHTPSHAAYSWVDDKGQFHITDYPKPEKQQPEEKAIPSEEEKTAAPASQKQASQPLAAPKQPQLPSIKSSASSTVLKTKGIVSSPGITAAYQSTGTTTPQSTGSKTVSPLPMQPVDPAIAKKTQLVALYTEKMKVIFILFLAIYFFTCLCHYRIAKKLDIPAAWLAWIPILQIWIFFKSAGKSLWWIIPCLIPFLNLFVISYLWICLVENLGHNKWLGLLMLIPGVNFVFLGLLAFSSIQENASSHTVQPY